MTLEKYHSAGTLLEEIESIENILFKIDKTEDWSIHFIGTYESRGRCEEFGEQLSVSRTTEDKILQVLKDRLVELKEAFERL